MQGDTLLERVPLQSYLYAVFVNCIPNYLIIKVVFPCVFVGIGTFVFEESFSVISPAKQLGKGGGEGHRVVHRDALQQLGLGVEQLGIGAHQLLFPGLVQPLELLEDGVPARSEERRVGKECAA